MSVGNFVSDVQVVRCIPSASALSSRRILAVLCRSPGGCGCSPFTASESVFELKSFLKPIIYCTNYYLASFVGSTRTVYSVDRCVYDIREDITLGRHILRDAPLSVVSSGPVSDSSHRARATSRTLPGKEFWNVTRGAMYVSFQRGSHAAFTYRREPVSLSVGSAAVSPPVRPVR